MVEEDDGELFRKKLLEVKVDGFAGGGVERFAAVFKEFVRPGMIEMRDVGLLGGMPQRILIRVGGYFLTDYKSGEFRRNFGNNLNLCWDA